MTGHSASSSGAMRRKGSKGKDPFETHDLKVLNAVGYIAPVVHDLFLALICVRCTFHARGVCP